MKRVFVFVIILLVVMQFVKIDKQNPAVMIENDFISIEKPSDEVASLLRKACYDCHSNNTEYPWYTNVAPISFWIKHHIDEAREHVNFSEWGTYKKSRQKHKMHECYEEVEEGEMPLKTYTLMHSEAKLSKEERAKLEHWFKSFGPFEEEEDD